MKFYILKQNCFTKGSYSPLHNMCDVRLITLSKKRAQKMLEKEKLEVEKKGFSPFSTTKNWWAFYVNKQTEIAMELRIDIYKCNIFGRKERENNE